jgi:hypothetical protein
LPALVAAAIQQQQLQHVVAQTAARQGQCLGQVELL